MRNSLDGYVLTLMFVASPPAGCADNQDFDQECCDSCANYLDSFANIIDTGACEEFLEE